MNNVIQIKDRGRQDQPKTIGEILSLLLKRRGLSESELHRQTGVTQQAISSITRGITLNPRVDTVATLAQFFGVSMDQLVGVKPLNESPLGTDHSKKKLAPILEWDRVPRYLANPAVFQSKENVSWVKHNHDQDYCFAIRSNPSLEPLIRRNAILILNPIAKPANLDFVLVRLNKEHFTVRVFIQEGGSSYLKPIDISLPATALAPEHTIFGTVVSMQFDVV